jgi:hypothetical protein
MDAALDTPVPLLDRQGHTFVFGHLRARVR